MIFELLTLITGIAEPPARLELARIEWASLHLDRVAVRLHLRAFTKIGTTLHDVRFDQMSIGGVPFSVAPLAGPIAVPAGEWVDLPPLSVTVYYRDVQAIAALRRMIEKGSVTVKGTARCEVQLPLLARIVLLSSRMSLVYPIDQEIKLPAWLGHRDETRFRTTEEWFPKNLAQIR
jgi:hypothetical protein